MKPCNSIYIYAIFLYFPKLLYIGFEIINKFFKVHTLFLISSSSSIISVIVVNGALFVLVSKNIPFFLTSGDFSCLQFKMESVQKITNDFKRLKKKTDIEYF